MTVRYTYHCSDNRLASFYSLLFRWRGSIYKLIWKETLIFLVLYYALVLVYIFALNHDQKEDFRRMAQFFSSSTNLIPISLLLGAFVAFAVSDRWNNFVSLIPWPDRAILKIAGNVHGSDENGRMIRRTMARYLNLSAAIVLQQISQAFNKRFKQINSLCPYLITEKELRTIILNEQRHNNTINLYSLPIEWASTLLHKAHGERRITDDSLLVSLLNEFMNFRGNLGSLNCLNWITIPLVYSQVVAIAVYTFLLSTLLGRRFEPNLGIVDNIEMYFPVLTFWRFIFYMGWLKVAETLMNPLGEDDDDFEINYIADRNLQISYALVDDFYDSLPELQKDIDWYTDLANWRSTPSPYTPPMNAQTSNERITAAD